MLLIRHGQTEHNAQQRLAGWTDSALSDLGRRQADALGRHIVETYQLDRIVASPLQRAWRTALAITSRLGCEPEPLPDLREIHFGDLEGLAWVEFERHHPELFRQWEAAPTGELRWPGGESRSEFRERVARAFQPIEAESRRRVVAVVCHGGVIGSYLAHRLTNDPTRWSEYHVHNCSVSEIAWEPDGQPRLHRWNDIGHLNDVSEGG